MYNAAETHRLHTPEVATGMLLSFDQDIQDRGESLSSGIDCALEILGKKIAIFVSGEPAPPEHPIVVATSHYDLEVFDWDGSPAEDYKKLFEA